MAKSLVAGNWKMNLTPDEGAQLIASIHNGLGDKQNTDVLFCPPFTHLQSASEAIKATVRKNFYLGAQNCYFQASGAYTGEISIAMLQALNVTHVLVGHSERRGIFAEDNALLKQKVDALLASKMTPVFCCGEPLEVRENNTQNSYVEQQLLESILHLDATQIQNIVIAYEPIWAIGTGVTASTSQAQEMHAYLRSVLEKKYAADIAEQITILYGGSCNPGNAEELFAQADVNGGLIGGAALKADQFIAIINAAN